MSNHSNVFHSGAWRIRHFLAMVASLALFLLQAATAVAQDQNASQVRSAIKAIWDKPGAAVDIDPVVVVANHAIAGWTQEDRGGRALLRKEHGKWTVIVCGGDGLAKAAALRQTGMSATDAGALEKAVAKAETGIPEARRKKFALFEGMVRVDGAQGHAAHGAHAGHEDQAHKK